MALLIFLSFDFWIIFQTVVSPLNLEYFLIIPPNIVWIPVRVCEHKMSSFGKSLFLNRNRISWGNSLLNFWFSFHFFNHPEWANSSYLPESSEKLQNLVSNLSKLDGFLYFTISFKKIVGAREYKKENGIIILTIAIVIYEIVFWLLSTKILTVVFTYMS